MLTFKRDEPCPKCGNHKFVHEMRFVAGEPEALLIPTCKECLWHDKPRKSA